MSTTAPPSAAPAAASTMNRREALETLSGLFMGLFVAILASTIVANALPRIITDLKGSQSVYAWVVTTELLAMTATVPLWGKLSDLYSKKLLVQVSLCFFLVGSLLAGFAPNVQVLLVSRVAQGIGGGGLTALVQVIMAAVIPPRQLGRYSGVFSAIFAVATVAGPLVGGVLVDTSWLGWRWCFFIGVPFTIAAIVLLQRTLHLPVTRRKAKVDYLGAVLIMGGVSTLLIWSSLAGNKFAWGSVWTAILVAGGLVMLVFAGVVENRVAEPIVPLSIFRNRTVALATLASALVGIAMFGGSIFLSQYFQIGLGKSPTVAGLMGLPLIFGLMVSSTVAGQLISRFGRWKAFLVAGGICMPLGFGLLSTIGLSTSQALLSAYMVVLGLGVGMLMQNLVLAAQNDVPARQLGTTTSTISFFRSMGGAIGVSVLGAVLARRVTGYVTDRLGTQSGGSGGNTVPDIKTLPAPVVHVVQSAYAAATADLFLIATPIAVLALVAVLFIREKPLRTVSGTERLAQEAGTEQSTAEQDVAGQDVAGPSVAEQDMAGPSVAEQRDEVPTR